MSVRRSWLGMGVALCAVLLALGGCRAESPRMLSAFFGLDDGLPPQVGLICPGGAGTDGMPVTFDVEIDQRTLDASDFRVTLESGAERTPLCATLAPAIEENEDRTVLLIGDLGDAALDPPRRVEVVGSLLAEGRDAVDLLGLAIDAVTPLAAGPALMWAEALPEREWELDRPGDCPGVGTRQVLRATWAGGVVSLDGDELGDAERRRYVVSLLTDDGRIESVAPFALGDLNDGDNHHDLCLDRGGRPLWVEMLAGTVIDPNGDPNPYTDVPVTQRP